MNFVTSSTIPYYQFENLRVFENYIIHFVTTRNYKLPPSSNNFYSFGLNGAIGNESVLSNRKQLAEQLGFSMDSYVFASQVHGKKIAVVGDKDRGKGAFERSSSLCDVDGMITNQKNICIVTQAADCVPITFFDPIKKVIGVAHAGWKGTVAKIPAEMVKTFINEFESNPSDLIIGIGPSIGSCCYEVGDEVISKAEAAFGSIEGLILKNNKFTKPVFDLWEANRRALIEVGVKPSSIEIASICTKCSNSYFFSARAGDNGRFGAGIMIK